MRIGELARRTGVGVSTLRAWESRFGFLSPERSPSGHRLYSEADVELVEAVLRLVAEGMTLPSATARVAAGGTAALPMGEGEALLFGQILQAAGQGVWVTRDGRTRFANRRMAEMLRCSIDDMLTRSAYDFVDPAELQATRDRVEAARRGSRMRFTTRVRRFDGSVLLAGVDIAPLFDQAGRYQGSVAVIDDITERSAAEARERVLSVLLDSIGEAVAAADAEGRIVYVNAAAERLFGWRAADVVGSDGRRLLAAPGATNEADRVHEVIRSGERYAGVMPLARADGSVFPARITGAPAFDANGELVGLIAVIADETDRVALEDHQRASRLQSETVALLGAQALRERSAAGRTAFLGEVLDATRRVLGADHVTVFAAHESGLVVQATSPSSAFLDTVVAGGGGSFAGYCTLARSVVVVDDTTRDRRFEMTLDRPDFRCRSAVGAPILGRTKLAGVLTAESGEVGHFEHSIDHFVQGMANVIGTGLVD